jgi:cell division initiation protein
MRLTPLDIQNHRFSHRLRGFDPAEVEDFLRVVGEDYESLAQENETLRGAVRGLELRVAELAGQEGRLRDTMVTAQALTEDLKRTAIREAEMMIGEAEVRAEKILDEAHRKAAKIQEEIRELRLMRGRVAAAMRATLETQSRILEGLLSEEADAVPAEPAAAWRQLPVPASAAAPSDRPAPGPAATSPAASPGGAAATVAAPQPAPAAHASPDADRPPLPGTSRATA